MSTQVNSVDQLKVVPTGGALGAEIQGLDLSHPFPEETVNAVRQAFLDHCVIFFRQQDISEEDQVRFTRYFGQPVPHVRSQPDRPIEEIFIISNVKENGQLIGALGNSEIAFHSDLAYMPQPGTISILYAVELPNQGGETHWANGYAAYEALDDATKERLKGLRATHRHHRDEQNPPEVVDHPIVCTHPETGRKTLYVSPHFAKTILELEEAEGSELLDSLINHAIQPEFVWTHDWQVGDLIMWDNRPTMHRREDFPEDQRRIMKRTQVFNDEVPVE